MPITHVTRYSPMEIKAAAVIPATKQYPGDKRTKHSFSRPYTVELSGAALARSLKLEGYSVTTICIKMGVDVRTVKQYLGIIESDATPTHVQTAATYTAPRSITQARDQLHQDLNQLNITWTAWPKVMHGRLKGDKSAE